MRLIKDAAHLQLPVGAVVINWTDDGEQYGPVLGGGKIGFRQMQGTIGRYRNLRVGELRAEGK